MKENLKVDKDYMEAFNLGYQLAKELNIKSPMFKNIELDNSRMHALNTGMEEYSKEFTLNKNITLDDSKIIQKENKNNQEGNELSL